MLDQDGLSAGYAKDFEALNWLSSWRQFAGWYISFPLVTHFGWNSKW